jgi:uncharacterized membrane protein
MNYPTVDDIVRNQRMKRTVLMMGLISTLLLIFAVIAGLFYFVNVSAQVAFIAGFGVLIVVVVPFIVWNNPRAGFFMTLFSSMIFEGVSNGYGATATVPTSYVPFFWNINNAGANYGTSALDPLKFSLAELLIALTIITWIIRSITMRDFKFQKGAFFGWFMAYIVMVCVGWMRGVATGGDATMALWEVRSQFHFFAAYLMGANLITERKHAYTVLWIAIIGVGLKGLVGIYAYIQMGGVVGEQGVLYHEESLFFNIIVFIMFITWLSNADQKMKWASLLLSPACIFTALQNQRRSGIAAFIVALIPLIPILMVVLEQRRPQVIRFVIGFAIFNAFYLPAGWHSQAAWALPARAIKSNSDPSERDASSDYYRMAENFNLKATRDQSPIVGIGYGKPYLMIIYQPGIDQFDRFLKFLPHNSILWVWMRIGHIGFLCLMMVLATVCVKGSQILKATQDPVLQTVGALGILAPLMLFTFGKYDLAFVNYRVVIMTGSFMGILSVLPRLQHDPAANSVIVKNPDLLVAPPPDIEEEDMFGDPRPAPKLMTWG